MFTCMITSYYNPQYCTLGPDILQQNIVKLKSFKLLMQKLGLLHSALAYKLSRQHGLSVINFISLLFIFELFVKTLMTNHLVH